MNWNIIESIVQLCGNVNDIVLDVLISELQ